MEPNKDREGVEGWKKDLTTLMAARTFTIEEIENFIKERFVYKPNLIALVEGVAAKLREIMMAFIKHEGLNIQDVGVGYAGGYLRAITDFEEEFAALKDTLSNKENV